MSFETKHIKGHGLGTNMDWLCIKHKDEGFGFGDREAITCVDMTIHSVDHGRPNTVFSTYKKENISESDIKYKFIKGAYTSPEQVALAKEVIGNWDGLKRKETLELDNKIKRW